MHGMNKKIALALVVFIVGMQEIALVAAGKAKEWERKFGAAGGVAAGVPATPAQKPFDPNRPLDPEEEAGMGAFLAGLAQPGSGHRVTNALAEFIGEYIEPKTYELVATLNNRLPVASLAFSPDSTVLASGSYGGTINLWTVETKKLLRTINLKFVISSLAFSANNKILYSANASPAGGTINLWGVEAGKLLRTFDINIEGFLQARAFSPDRRIFAAGSRTGTITLWDVETGKLLHTLQGHGNGLWVYSVAFSPDGTTLASCSPDDNTIKLWDVNSGTLKLTISSIPGTGNIVGQPEIVTFSPNGRMLASGGGIHIINLRDSETGKLIRTFKEEEDAISLVFNPDNATLVAGFKDGTIKIWDIETGELQQTLEGHTSSVHHLVFNPDGSMFASSGFADGDVKLWRRPTDVQEAIDAARREYAALHPIGAAPAAPKKGPRLPSTPKPVTLIVKAITNAYKTAHVKSIKKGNLQVLMQDWLNALAAGNNQGMEKARGAINIIDPTLGITLQTQAQHITTLLRGDEKTGAARRQAIAGNIRKDMQ